MQYLCNFGEYVKIYRNMMILGKVLKISFENFLKHVYNIIEYVYI